MTDTPKRIQRKRTKGWRMPEGAVYVGRPSRWGNPFHIVSSCDGSTTRAEAVRNYRGHLLSSSAVMPSAVAAYLEPLRGKDLACWCPLSEPCHADVLLELANGVGA
jgi:hypothetical protein